MPIIRKSPEKILEQIHIEEHESKQGKLKIFFGYAAGVGKTYAMLEAAHEAKKQGIDVVAGYIEPHARPATAALVNGLEVISPLVINHKDITLNEFNLDAAIKRNPQLILVDELAHTNADGCRHIKRYQDIEELLKAGIDVYTTINVQHIESLNDIVASITKIIVRERIPDRIFDEAEQVELVDIEPSDLVTRLSEGKIYQKEQADRALGNFFTVENLTALREIALRRMADRVNKISLKVKNENNKDYYTNEHILVCLSSSPSNSKIIRTAARMANAFKAQFTALFVQTSSFEKTSLENKKRLKENIHLAEQLGAKIEMVVGEDIPFQIAEFARLAGVSKLVIGRSIARNGFMRLMRKSFTDKLIEQLPNLDIHVIPDNKALFYKKFWKKSVNEREICNTSDIITILVILIITSMIGMLFYSMNLGEANIMTVYILGVLIAALKTSKRLYSVVLSVLNVLAFDFLFIEPRYTFTAYDPVYIITFSVMFVSAFVTGGLTNKIKKQAIQSAKLAYRTKILLETNQLLQQAGSDAAIATVTSHQLLKLLNKTIVYYSADKKGLLPPVVYNVKNDVHTEQLINSNERAVAQWVYKNNKRAGVKTGTLNNAKCQYLAIRSKDNVYGVVGIAIDNEDLDVFENNLVLSILGECALALEKEIYSKKRQEIYLQAKNEQLRSNLLRSISHDLRTPLTSISGNADFLLSNSAKIDDVKRQELYNNIYDDSMWLINLVENILFITRIENKTMKINLQTELLDDIINEALKHLYRRGKNHHIVFEETKDIMMVKVDARLLVQVFINIIDNAIKYTPKGSTITISTKIKSDKIEVSIADNGQGISDEAKDKLFEMFYTANSTVADSRRGIGIGLSLCKSIIMAHGGEIKVRDNKPQGTVFIFTLPKEEINFNE